MLGLGCFLILYFQGRKLIANELIQSGLQPLRFGLAVDNARNGLLADAVHSGELTHRNARCAQCHFEKFWEIVVVFCHDVVTFI